MGLKGEVWIHAGVPPEPDDKALAAALAVAGAFAPDAIIGLGGGSVMDITNLVSELWYGEQMLAELVGPNKVARHLSWPGLVAASAGTGSEAGIRALVTHSDYRAAL